MKLNTNYIAVLSLVLLYSTHMQAQAPYIKNDLGTADGLGGYGYLEKDATTFVRMHRNTYGNINQLRARWFVTDNNPGNGNGIEYIYNTNDGPEGTWNCDNGTNHKRTTDYSASHFGSEWQAGAQAYVSVYAQYGCPVNSSSHSSGTGFNERQFRIVDVAQTGAVSTGVTDGNGSCLTNNVVGSFTIDVGTASGISLRRFFVQNSGTATEGTNIPNDGIKLFYETSTGSESFDGTESSSNLYGDWGGDSQTNNIYGFDNANINLSGLVRFYLVVCDMTSTVIPTASRPTAFNFSIINDGISMSPNLDGQNTLRINQTSLGGAAPFPVVLASFTGRSENKASILEWQTSTEIGNSHFEVQRSFNLNTFENIGRVEGYGTTTTDKTYVFTDAQPRIGANYYRLKQVDFDGKFSYSRIISVIVRTNGEVALFPNPTAEKLRVEGLESGSLLSV
nr:hypothetical protein [Spirosomataceae bacterium]